MGLETADCIRVEDVHPNIFSSINVVFDVRIQRQIRLINPVKMPSCLKLCVFRRIFVRYYKKNETLGCSAKRAPSAGFKGWSNGEKCPPRVSYALDLPIPSRAQSCPRHALVLPCPSHALVVPSSISSRCALGLSLLTVSYDRKFSTFLDIAEMIDGTFLRKSTFNFHKKMTEKNTFFHTFGKLTLQETAVFP